ncbi:amidohydrolase family protein [Mucilaginibacter roseus]|uniref:Amidohydrolase family protein n=1 Tax=Mucilaginibacter roseus TaxID=1528868 RepID=A0ABS8U728_9SPHI|nr:amidohydrolase family protein [Mucilaginibacter roseus]MCD8741915.1 amidohydrolase family protein [Mucilaginibacter roseus]
MKSFRADYVFPVYADPIKNGIVTVDDNGKILAVTNDPSTIPGEIEQLSGVLCPGFINTHCHLELSHMKDRIAPGNGLVNFVKEVISMRRNVVADEQEVINGAIAADEMMYNNGIVAVGDIANTDVTASVKKQSKIYYHTFVEAMSFVPERAQVVFDQALQTLEAFKPLSASITPHAPYSVSKELFRLIKKHSDTGKNLISIHNQECEDENKFYRYKLGAFNDLYKFLEIDIEYFKPQARNSIQSIIPLLSNNQDILLVHNTCTNLKDIYFVKRFDKMVNWCFCPNANLYIEKRLPKINLFMDQGFNITLGTDSMASNHTLSILSEMATIQQHFPQISLERLVQWATINGAEFLGVDDNLGTLEKGKTPGLNLISGLDNLKITTDTKVRRLI